MIVHEVQREAGYCFKTDLQELENWTLEHDVLDELREMELTTAFAQRVCRDIKRSHFLHLKSGKQRSGLAKEIYHD